LNSTKREAQKEAVRVQMTASGLANADLELLRRIRRIAEVLAELTREYEGKPNPRSLESIRAWATELADLSVRLRTAPQEERSPTPDQV
jgi:hypothetical protein